MDKIRITVETPDLKLVKSWDPRRVLTTPRFWDCGCSSNYIRAAAEPVCLSCGNSAVDSPDSRVDEVVLMLLTTIDPVKGVDTYTVATKACSDSGLHGL